MDPIVDLACTIMPAQWQVPAGLLWRFESQNKSLEWKLSFFKSSASVVAATYTSNDGVLRLEATALVDHAHKACTVHLICRNISDAASTLSLVQPLRMSWTVPEGDVAYVCKIGGGDNEKLYPPHALRLDTVRLEERGDFFSESGSDGRSSNSVLPFLIGSCGKAGWVFALEWSGMWFSKMSRSAEGGPIESSMNIPVRDLILAPGETLDLPTAHYVFSHDGGFDGATIAIRRYIGDCISPPLNGYPMKAVVNYNHWSGIWAAITEEKMLRMVTAAARAGARYAVLDAGWYAGCVGADFQPGVGNWETVDAKKFPDGLQTVSDHARRAGMKLGLWFEPERARRDSDWGRRHREWFWDIGSNFLHLNLALPEAQDECIALMVGTARQLKLGWIKIDYNIGPKLYWEHADPTLKIQFAYMQGLYRVLDEVIAALPGVIIETCASGGRRLDLGILRRSHTTWISDESLYSQTVRFMLSGANRVLPGHLNNEAIQFARSEGHHQVFDYDVACRMLGTLAIHGDLDVLSNADLQKLRQQVDLYGSFSELLSEDFYPLTRQPSTSDDWEAVQFVTPDGSDAVVFCFSGQASCHAQRSRLRALRADSCYAVTALHKAAEPFAALGSDLMQLGITAALKPLDWAAWRVRRLPDARMTLFKRLKSLWRLRAG